MSDDTPTMRSSRPYLVRALIDWIVDSNCTPYLVLSTAVDGVVVPRQHVSDGKIVLNVSGTAIRNFSLEQDELAFDSRFSGENFHISAPVGAVIGVYAKETGQGMAFEPEAAAGAPGGDDPSADDGPRKGPNLKLV